MEMQEISCATLLESFTYILGFFSLMLGTSIPYQIHFIYYSLKFIGKFLLHNMHGIACRFFAIEFTSLPPKLRSNADFALQNYGAMQTLPRKIMEPSVIVLLNHGAFILCLAKLSSNADFSLQNQGDIVSWAKLATEIILKLDFLFSIFLYINAMLLQRSVKELGPV